MKKVVISGQSVPAVSAQTLRAIEAMWHIIRSTAWLWALPVGLIAAYGGILGNDDFLWIWGSCMASIGSYMFATRLSGTSA